MPDTKARPCPPAEMQSRGSQAPLPSGALLQAPGSLKYYPSPPRLRKALRSGKINLPHLPWSPVLGAGAGGFLPQGLRLPPDAGRGRGPRRRGSQESTEPPSTQLSPSSPTVRQGLQPQDPELPGWALLGSCCLQSGHKLLRVKGAREPAPSGPFDHTRLPWPGSEGPPILWAARWTGSPADTLGATMGNFSVRSSANRKRTVGGSDVGGQWADRTRLLPHSTGPGRTLPLTPPRPGH